MTASKDSTAMFKTRLTFSAVFLCKKIYLQQNANCWRNTLVEVRQQLEGINIELET